MEGPKHHVGGTQFIGRALGSQGSSLSRAGYDVQATCCGGDSSPGRPDSGARVGEWWGLGCGAAPCAPPPAAQPVCAEGQFCQAGGEVPHETATRRSGQLPVATVLAQGGRPKPQLGEKGAPPGQVGDVDARQGTEGSHGQEAGGGTTSPKLG